MATNFLHTISIVGSIFHSTSPTKQRGDSVVACFVIAVLVLKFLVATQTSQYYIRSAMRFKASKIHRATKVVTKSAAKYC
eukprot:scaffold281_cov318-Pavlova_lutheri.AAC.21